MEMKIGELERNLKEDNRMGEEINEDNLGLVEAIGTIPLLMLFDIYDKSYCGIKRASKVIKEKINNLSSFVLYGINFNDNSKDDEEKYHGKMRFRF